MAGHWLTLRSQIGTIGFMDIAVVSVKMQKQPCPPVSSLRQSRRAAAPAIALCAFVAAWVMVVSEPAIGDEADSNQSLHQAASNTPLPAFGNFGVLAQTERNDSRVLRLAQDDLPRGTPLYGEISSIEPLKQSVQSKAGAGISKVKKTPIDSAQAEIVVGYRVHVRLDNGDTRSFERKTIDGLDVGARVRIQNGSVRGA